MSLSRNRRPGDVGQTIRGRFAGGSEVAWGPWLTLADLDGGGVPDRDTSSLVNSVTEPAAGELLFDLTTGAATHDSINTAATFYISHSVGGFWDASLLVGDPTKGLILEITRLASATGFSGTQPFFGIGLRHSPSGNGTANSLRMTAATTGYLYTCTWSSGSSGSEITNVLGARCLVMASLTQPSPANPDAGWTQTGYGYNTSFAVPTSYSAAMVATAGNLTGMTNPANLQLILIAGNTASGANNFTGKFGFRTGIVELFPELV